MTEGKLIRNPAAGPRDDELTEAQGVIFDPVQSIAFALATTIRAVGDGPEIRNALQRLDQMVSWVREHVRSNS